MMTNVDEAAEKLYRKVIAVRSTDVQIREAVIRDFWYNFEEYPFSGYQSSSLPEIAEQFRIDVMEKFQNMIDKETIKSYFEGPEYVESGDKRYDDESQR